jgi:hypothetical protein
MFLGMYRFDGDPAELVAAYDRLIAGFPPGMIELQLCVRRPDGITVFDTCPSAEVFAEFSTSEGFAGALRAAGLPTPTVEPLGDVHHAITPS